MLCIVNAGEFISWLTFTWDFWRTSLLYPT